MADLKASSLHISFSVSGTNNTDPENVVGWHEPLNIVIDFSNESATEQQLKDYPWIEGVIAPVIKELNKIHEARLADHAKPKEKTAALKSKLKGLI